MADSNARTRSRLCRTSSRSADSTRPGVPAGAPPPSSVAMASRRSASPNSTGVGPGKRRSRSPSTPAACVDWVATSTEPPRSTTSMAAATTAWLLPQPGGPDTTVSGRSRADRTTSCWAGFSGSGDSGASPSSSAAVAGVPYTWASADVSTPGRLAQDSKPSRNAALYGSRDRNSAAVGSNTRPSSGNFRPVSPGGRVSAIGRSLASAMARNQISMPAWRSHSSVPTPGPVAISAASSRYSSSGVTSMSPAGTTRYSRRARSSRTGSLSSGTRTRRIAPSTVVVPITKPQPRRSSRSSRCSASSAASRSNALPRGAVPGVSSQAR